MIPKRIQYIIDEIVDQYMYADTSFRPWIIGFSGGKDSTVLLMLTWLALRKIKETIPAPFQLRRPIYVVCNDTLSEVKYSDVFTESEIVSCLVKIRHSARGLAALFLEGILVFVSHTRYPHKGYAVKNYRKQHNRA